MKDKEIFPIIFIILSTTILGLIFASGGHDNKFALEKIESVFEDRNKNISIWHKQIPKKTIISEKEYPELKAKLLSLKKTENFGSEGAKANCVI